MAAWKYVHCHTYYIMSLCNKYYDHRFDRYAVLCSVCSLTSSGTAISSSQASPVLSGVEAAGSLDRGKAALERRNKKTAMTAGGGVADDGFAKTTTGRVEVTRVNPDSLIDQLLKATNLDDHSADEDSKHSKQRSVANPIGCVNALIFFLL